VGWEKLVDDGEYFRRRGISRLVEQINQSSREQQEEWDSSEEDVESNSACQKENVVLAAVVPDPLRVIAKQPTEPGREPALRH
jgi:hypothetical protein